MDSESISVLSVFIVEGTESCMYRVLSVFSPLRPLGMFAIHNLTSPSTSRLSTLPGRSIVHKKK